MKLKSLFYLLVGLTFYMCKPNGEPISHKQPNFLFCIADDWSFPHAGVYGDAVVKTPHFDRLAQEGVLFMNAYTAASSCSPSRAAILTGQDMYRLKAGGCLFGSLPSSFAVYPDILNSNGYAIGHTGKGYGPADLELGGWSVNPAGPAYQSIESETPVGIRSTDYAGNFKAFMSAKVEGTPFCFWYGASEPHRRYDYGIGARNGYDLQQIKVPEFLPDAEETRNDVADYYYEVEWFDDHLGKIIAHLEEMGELGNTVIVVTSDNGMPFPRAKSNSYNFGVQMPLAIRWGKGIRPGQVVQSPVSLTDIAPTFLELAEIPIPDNMTGKSLASLLEDGENDQNRRTFAVTTLERHTLARRDKLGYPIRAIHTQDYTYIYNFEPDRWPAGAPDVDAWPQGFYGDIDGGASKTLFEENPDKWPELFQMSTGKRPQEELYSIKNDLFNLANLAEEEEFAEIKKNLKTQLFDYLKLHQDPRMNGESPWDSYVFTGGDEWEK